MADTIKAERCGFCGKSKGGVDLMVAGPNVNICDACVDLCAGMVEAQREKEKMAAAFPADPKAFLHAVANHLIGASGFTSQLGYENNVEISDALHALAEVMTVTTSVAYAPVSEKAP